MFLHWWKKNETLKQQLLALFGEHKPSVLTSLQEPACLILLTALTGSSTPALTAFVAPTPIIRLTLSSSNYWFKILLSGEDFFTSSILVTHSQNNIEDPCRLQWCLYLGNDLINICFPFFFKRPYATDICLWMYGVRCPWDTQCV